MKIVIIGSSGFVGRNLFNDLKKDYEVYGLSRRNSLTTTHQADITNPNINKILDSLNPDVVLHSVKLPKPVDYYETHKNEAIETELKGLGRIAKWVGENNKKLIYISSNYVYPGETNNYDENSTPKPLNVYGNLKFQAENLVKKFVKNYAILRTIVVFGYEKEGKNFLMQMLNSKEKKNIPSDQIDNPTSISVLSKYAKGVIEKDIRGLFVATGPETMSRVDFAYLIADVFKLNKSLINPVSTKELNQLAKRPLNNGANSSKIMATLDYTPPTIIESLNIIKKNVTK